MAQTADHSGFCSSVLIFWNLAIKPKYACNEHIYIQIYLSIVNSQKYYIKIYFIF